ncbi:sigma-70 family RNA polymerase sigma factor [Streptomyces mirabilis]|uniref:sigma-70 family RNA polymerase sigma factor n=1 Tax=Streptomyces mirabilis TaxID=68239 RepID=UPI003807F397
MDTPPAQNTPPPPPAPFEALAHLVDGPESIEQAAILTQALKAVPDLQTWLRERRQHVVNTLHDRDGMSYTDMAPHLQCTPQRVSNIASGHSRSGGKARRGQATETEPAEAL